MPGWLQAFASNQPVSIVINAARDLMVGRPPASSIASHLFTGSTVSDIWHALAWIVGVFVVLAPLAVHRYRSRI
jgi:hypothetical protein